MKNKMTPRGVVAGRSGRAFAAVSVALALVLGTATAAHAEGSWTSDMTQVQPTFESRTWADKNLDAAHTIITLSNCRGNAAGKSVGSKRITSVRITLSGGASITKACGTYDFGRTADSHYNSFKVSAINGKTGAKRKIFLNADVKVSF
ncbi:hypothetical protein [Curtobacterium aetherium]|uniref:Uncharacterized protein n=1 Tax=Curtobacterium aetherium TaxID=2841594 RepID=A0ACD1E3D9_9MICO|nr:hypothetical protein [Curtobacterium sp. L6-1]QWS33241.1 hypothetical protein KM842_13500 [Curtobacterium sp. L6-1]